MKNKGDNTEDLQGPEKEDASRERLRVRLVKPHKLKIKTDRAAPKDLDNFGYERCFPAETLIQMADGSRRPIAAIRADDSVCCWDWERRSMASGRVVEVLQAYAGHLVRINGCLAASPSHRIMTPGGYLRFDEIRPGFEVFRGPEITLEPVCSIEVSLGPVQVFNLVVEPFACFFAEGFLVEDQVGAESELRVNGTEPEGYRQLSLEAQLPSGISPT